MTDRLTSSIEFKRGSLTATGEVSGYASTFGGIDRTGDTIAKGAFADSIARKMPKMFYNHALFNSNATPIGKWLEAREDANGLFVRGKLFIDGDNPVELAKDVYRCLKEGVITQMSIGFLPLDFRYDGDTRIIERVELMEVSFVNEPANPDAVVTDVKSLKCARQIEDDLRDAGLSARDAVKAVHVFKKSGHWNASDLRKSKGADDRDDQTATALQLAAMRLRLL